MASQKKQIVGAGQFEMSTRELQKSEEAVSTLCFTNFCQIIIQKTLPIIHIEQNNKKLLKEA